jgi:hypothetical protein
LDYQTRSCKVLRQRNISGYERLFIKERGKFFYTGPLCHLRHSPNPIYLQVCISNFYFIFFYQFTKPSLDLVLFPFLTCSQAAFCFV